MKVLFFETKASVYGGQQAILGRCVALKAAGVDFTVFHNSGSSEFYGLLTKAGLSSHVKIMAGGRLHKFLIFRVLSLLLYGILYGNSRQSIFHLDSFDTAYPLLVLKICKLVRCNIVFTIRSERYLRFRYWDRFLLGFANKLITNSIFSKDNIEAFLDVRDKVKVHYSPVDFYSIEKSLSQQPARGVHTVDTVHVSYVGAIERRKRLDFFVEVAKAVLKQRPDFKFLVYGDSKDDDGDLYKAEIMSRIDEAQKTRLVFLGYRPIADAIAQTDILICPYQNEPLGRVVPEFLYFRRQVLVSSSGGLSEAGCGYAAVYVEDSVADCVQKLLTLVAAKPNNQSRIVEMRQRLLENFDAHECSKKDIDVYQKLISS